MCNTEAAISVTNLGKCYLVGHESGQREQYTALRDVVARNMRTFVRKLGDMAAGRQIIEGDQIEEFWALRDVSFDVKRGEILGIVGGNGAGKSTLLKILSRITEPTNGRVTLRGRVASLLEVGTGFHPELSGRENIYLNGAILGMSRREIGRKFDEIVEFAEVERFLDTPVKRYSSGMYVRLAFAVAAHLDPEILIVDEVLAVGDAHFQKKCLGKIQDVSRQEGRTVLFVSHNLAAVKALCTRALCLASGLVIAQGSPDTVLQRYLCSADSLADGKIPPVRPPQYENGPIRFTRVQMFSPQGEVLQTIVTGAGQEYLVEFSVQEKVNDIYFEFGIADCEGRQITQSRYPLNGEAGISVQRGCHQLRIKSSIVLYPGRYSLILGAHNSEGKTADWVDRALDFEVINASQDSPDYYAWGVRAYLRPQDEWIAPASFSVTTTL